MSLSENRSFLARILEGQSPSLVLNMMLETDPDLDKYELANIFLEEFDRLDSKVLPAIWHWKSIRSIRGMSDEKFDEVVLILLRSAGYKV
ncbi:MULTISPECIES: hypothetical protein [Pseudomonas]|uniref:hypothetical protein n=1 Tax=Pseudomonas TaxID=286 RepID=UPI001472EED6|nr:MULTISPECIES: hypothetical protein [Pseudomonas]NNA55730.1 hypothetical protein [Pseudomonas koreensis]